LTATARRRYNGPAIPPISARTANTIMPRAIFHARTARALVTGAGAICALLAGSTFTAATGYPCSPGTPPSAAFAAAIWVGAAAVMTAVSATLLRMSGQQWLRALSTDALTYLPLICLWTGVLAPGRVPVALLFWAAVASVGAAKMALLARLGRRGLVAIAASGVARCVGRLALTLSGFGRALAPFALVALAARWRVMHVYDGLALPEEGLLAHAAQVIRSGEILYRDLRSVFPPGAPYLHAGMFAAFGPTLVVGKIALGVGAALLPLAVYYLSQRMMPAGIAFLGAALVGLTGEGGLAAFFVMCAIGVGLARSGDRRANWMLAGILTGIAAAFDLPLAASAAAGMAIMLLLRERTFVMRRIGSAGADLALGSWAIAPLAMGAVVVWAPLLLYFASRGALGTMGADLLAGARGEIFRLLRGAPGWTEAWTPGFFYTVGGGLLLARLVGRRLGEADLVALAVIGLGAVGWAWSRGADDPYHLALCAPAAYMVTAWLFGWSAKAVGQSLAGWPGEDQRRVVRAGVAALVLIGATTTLSGWGRAAVGHVGEMARARSLVIPPRGWRPLDIGAAGGARVEARKAKALEALVDYLQRRTGTGERIFCGPGGPAIYFLAERSNATRLDYAYEGEVPGEQAAEAVVQLERLKVRTVVLAPTDSAWQPRVAMEKLIAGYLARRYLAVGRFGDYTVLARRGAQGAPKAMPQPQPAASRPVVPPASLFGPQGQNARREPNAGVKRKR